MRERRYLWVSMLIFLASVLPVAVGYSCANRLDNGYMDDYTWMTCYQTQNGHIAGRVHGSLSQTWWGQTGDQWNTYNYNNLYFYHAANRNRVWNWYYDNSGTCRTCCDSCCCGCGRSCSNYQVRYFSNYGNYWSYYWQSDYNSHDSKTLKIYNPCHPYCSSCNAKWSKTSCDSCFQTYHNAYKWLSYPDITYRRCDTYCRDRTVDNLYRGQYIKTTNDPNCYWCNTTCSKCEDLNGGNYCRTCITTAYLLASYSLCTSTFPQDSSNCHVDYHCVNPCPNNLYFELSEANAKTPTYDWSYYNSDANVRDTNVCYLCHRFCLTCTNKYDYTCSACAYSFYKWQQYSNRCNYYCREGVYTAGGTKGEFIDATYGADPHRRCSTCDTGCKYCATTSSTCYQCQDNYYLLDDKAECLAQYTCAQCQSTGSGGAVTDGCHSVNKHCRASNCPIFFYFEVSRTGSNNYASTANKYKFFTENETMNYGNNGYLPSSDSRTTNSS